MNKVEAEENTARKVLEQRFFEQIQRSSTWTVIFHGALAASFGLNPTDLKCRGLLDETGAITAGELAALTGLTTAAVTGVIDRLERAGLVQRAKDPHDRRRVVVEPLTKPEHLEQIDEGFGPLAEATTELVGSYSDDELALVLGFVEKSAALMRAQTLALRARKTAQRGEDVNGRET